MPTTTPNLGLTAYNTVTDASSVLIYAYADQVSGCATGQNLQRIDTFAGNTSSSLTIISASVVSHSASLVTLSASMVIANASLVIISGSAGQIATLTPNYAVVGRASTQTLADSTSASLLWDINISRNPTSMHSASSNSERLIIQRAGLWRAYTQAQFTAHASGSDILQLYINRTSASSYDLLGEQVHAGNASINNGFSITATTTAVAGDYFYVVAKQTSGAPLNLLYYSWFNPSFGCDLIYGTIT